VINIDKDQVIFCDEKLQSSKLKCSKQHSLFEKQMVSKMVQEIAEYEEEDELGIELPSEDKWEQADLIR
jgi:hypothetical protein